MKRDRGICSGCGLNTVTLAKKVLALRADRPAAVRLMIEAGFRATDLRFKRRGLKPLWQADHTVPVVEGGGGAHWSELRTLCLICHLEETAVLMARRRALKKG